jgi:hypothetical protein
MRPDTRALTLLEFVIVLAITATIGVILYAVFFQGVRAYARSRERLNVLGAARAVFNAVIPDVRSAIRGLEVDTKGDRLTLWRPRLTGGVPGREADGRLALEKVVFRHDASSGTLYENDRPVTGGLDDLEFRLEMLPVWERVGSPAVPRGTVEVRAQVGDDVVTFRTAAVPRFIATWTADPHWVYAGVWAPYTFEKGPK